MNAKPILDRHNVGTTIVAAGLSVLISIGLLIAVAELFAQDGTPLQNVVIAERACSELAFVSDRNACVRQFLAVSAHRRIASR
ncbi:MAG TPA: hypothetical protein VKG21_10950 [Casimicrobiaceae bacterium]|nr:hypothetical protein [Casimicrobiaceae bacterium]